MPARPQSLSNTGNPCNVIDCYRRAADVRQDMKQNMRTAELPALVSQCAVSSQRYGTSPSSSTSGRFATRSCHTGSYRGNTTRRRTTANSSTSGSTTIAGAIFARRNVNCTTKRSQPPEHIWRTTYRYVAYPLQHYRQHGGGIDSYSTYGTTALAYHSGAPTPMYQPSDSTNGSGNGRTNGTSVAYFGENIGDNKKGWQLLAAGQPSKAIDHFAAAVDANPLQAGPTLGYALAKALSGEYDANISVMLRADPAGFSELTMDSTLAETLNSLLYTYQEATPNGRDQAFMVTAVSYISCTTSRRSSTGRSDGVRQFIT